MKKNKKGFFLPETIVIITLVTTIMAFVYPNVVKLYENYENKVNYYDQTEDLYVLKAIYKSLEYDFEDLTTSYYIQDDTNLVEVNSNYYENFKTLKKLYITCYMSNPSSINDYNFNKYLKRLKKTEQDLESFRLVGIFENEEDNEKLRYASIKIDNPNSGKICNLGG